MRAKSLGTRKAIRASGAGGSALTDPTIYTSLQNLHYLIEKLEERERYLSSTINTMSSIVSDLARRISKLEFNTTPIGGL